MNKNKDTLKDLFNRLTLQEQNNVIDFAYLYDDIRGLRHQLQQKENIIKEVRERCDYLLKNDTVEINGKTYIKQKADNIIINYIKEILDKGE